MLRIPHCSDNLLMDGEAISLANRPRSTPLKRFIFLSLVRISVRG
jgi:hypothetical protein